MHYLIKVWGVALHKFKKFPLDFIEIMNEGYHVLDRYNYKFHLETLEDCGLKNVIHASFSDLNIAALNEKLRRAMLGVIFETIEIAHEMSSLGCSPSGALFATKLKIPKSL